MCGGDKRLDRVKCGVYSFVSFVIVCGLASEAPFVGFCISGEGKQY